MNDRQLRRHIQSGQALFEARDYEAAYQELSQAIRLIEEDDISDLLTEETLAELFLLRGSSILSEYRDEAYKDPDIFNQILDDYEQAITIQPENALYYILRGRIYLAAKVGDFLAEAKQDFSTALEREPDNLDAAKHMGEVLSKQGQYDNAIYYLSRVINEGPTAEAYMMRGVCHFKMRPANFSAAAYDFGEAQKLMPRLEELYIWRAQCFQELERWEDALYEYDRLIELSPQNAGYYIDRGVIKHQIDPQGAMDDYSNALDIEDHPLARNNRAVLLAEQGDFVAAIQDAERTLELDQTHTIAYATLAEIYAQMGEREKFLEYLERAVRHYYDDVLELLETPAFQPYMDDPDFQALLRKPS